MHAGLTFCAEAHFEHPVPHTNGPTDRTVRYGGWMFSAPASFSTSVAPGCAGLYAIQVLNGTWTPCPFEPIFFGHAQNLLGSVVTTNQSYGRWIAHPRAGTGLYVSYAALPCTSVEASAAHRRRAGPDLPAGGQREPRSRTRIAGPHRRRTQRRLSRAAR